MHDMPSLLHRVKKNFNGHSIKMDYFCAGSGRIHLAHGHHTYNGCLVLILGSHAEVPGSMLGSIPEGTEVYTLSEVYYPSNTLIEQGVI